MLQAFACFSSAWHKMRREAFSYSFYQSSHKEETIYGS